MTPRPLSSLAFILAGATLSACGSSGSMPPATAFQGRPLPAQGRPEPDIGGVISTKTFVIPAGAYTRVTKNLIVFASTSVSIKGTLAVPPGISVAFFTPSFTIVGAKAGLLGGAISATLTNKNYLGPVNDFVSACRIWAQPNTLWQVGAGDNLVLTSSSRGGKAQSCTVTIGANRNAQNRQTLTLEPGVKGGTYPHRYIGQNGGWLAIGTPDVIAQTEAWAKKYGHSGTHAYSPAVVSLGSAVAAAAGGNGEDDPFGTLVNGVQVFTGYAGGIGGSVEIETGKIQGTAPRIGAGNGGNGGNVGSPLGSLPNPLDGTADSPNGIPADLVMGSGGGGGGIFIKAKVPANVAERAGSGGNPSTVLFEYAGSGCCSVVPQQPCCGYGNAGSVTLELAAPGIKGPHGNNRPNAPRNGRYSRMTFSGGTGTAWINPNTDTSKTTTEPGGTGASLTIVPPPHITIDSLRDYGLRIQIITFGNGGIAMSDCGGNPPNPPGQNGGNAGTLHDNGLAQYISAPGGAWGFNGGAGGDGTPPGKGGTAGTNDEGRVLGLAGQNGVGC